MVRTILIAGALALVACKSKSDDKATGGSKLEMKSNSAVCKKAMTCCELYVKVEKGASTPEDINLMCSGVALAATDAECDQFRQGYVATLESGGKTVPAECK